MNVLQILYIAILIVSILVLAILGVSAWRKRDTRGALSFAMYTSSGATIALSYLGLSLSADPATGYIWAKLRFLGMPFLGVFYLLFVLEYTGTGEKQISRLFVALSAFPLLLQVVIWTNEYHHLFFVDWQHKNTGLLYADIAVFGSLYWIYSLYMYGLVIVAFTILVLKAFQSKGVYRHQIRFLVLGSAAAILSSIPGTLSLLSPPYNAFPVGSVVTGLLFWWALFKYELFDLVPMAFDTVFQNISSAVVVLDRQNRIVEVNPAALQFMKHQDNGIQGLDFRAAMQDRELADEMLKPFDDIPDYLKHEAKIYEVHISSLMHDEIEQGRLIMLQDVTERKAAEEQLQISEQRLSIVVDNSPVMLFALNDKGVFTFVRGRPLADTSVRSQLQGQSISVLTGYPDIEAKFQQVLNGTEIAEEVQYDDECFEVRASPLLTPENEVIGVIGVAVDITERKTAEQYESNLRLEQERVRFISDFINQASHEFRTPLSVIKTNVYLLGRQISDPHLQSNINKIEKQTDELSRLVSDLSVLLSLDSQKELKFTNVDVNSIIRDIHFGFDTIIEEKQLDFKCESVEDILIVRANVSMLQSALVRILDNAIRYTPDGGSVTVRVALEDDSNCVSIQFIDTGIGIKADDIPHIFDRLYRIDPARTTRGFGLGLSIARSTIEKHGGSIQVESEFGAGSTFTVALPLASPL